MKKLSIALILTISVVLSMFSIVNAASTNYFYSDGTAYSWSFDEGSGKLSINKVSNGSYSTTDYSSVASNVTSIEIDSIHRGSNQTKYIFTNFASGLNKVTTITVNGICNKLGSLKNCPKLTTINFNDNSSGSTRVDLTGWPSSTCPSIVYNKSNNNYYLDFSNSTCSSVTVPSSYSTDQKFNYSFENSSVNSVVFQKGTTTVPAKAFYCCKSLNSVTIPSSVTKIGDLAFGQCENLKTISIPTSVNEISFDAFQYSGIKEISYDGKIEQWKKLVKTADENGDKVLHLDNATIRCSDGVLNVSKNPATNHYEYKQFIKGWFKQAGIWYYYDDKGQKLTSTTKKIDGEYYHFDSNGAMVTGWYKENGKWYFFDKKSGKMKRASWIDDNGSWYYTDNDGVMVTGNRIINGNSYYFTSSGVMATGWTKIGDYWYYYDTNGSKYIGWKKIDGTWYYLCDKAYAPSSDFTGCMATGRMKIDGKVYYFASSGAMQTGWVHIGNDWFYFASNGAMQSGGWVQVGSDWYYLNENGTMYCGWLRYNNHWYYLQHSGVMATSQITIDTKGYIFRSDGVCINPY